MSNYKSFVYCAAELIKKTGHVIEQNYHTAVHDEGAFPWAIKNMSALFTDRARIDSEMDEAYKKNDLTQFRLKMIEFCKTDLHIYKEYERFLIGTF